AAGGVAAGLEQGRLALGLERDLLVLALARVAGAHLGPAEGTAEVVAALESCAGVAVALVEGGGHLADAVAVRRLGREVVVAVLALAAFAAGADLAQAVVPRDLVADPLGGHGTAGGGGAALLNVLVAAGLALGRAFRFRGRTATQAGPLVAGGVLRGA